MSMEIAILCVHRGAQGGMPLESSFPPYMFVQRCALLDLSLMVQLAPSQGLLEHSECVKSCDGEKWRNVPFQRR